MTHPLLTSTSRIVGDREDGIYVSFDEAPLDDVDHELEGSDAVLQDAPWANPDAPPLSPAAERDLKTLLTPRLSVDAMAAVARTAKAAVVPHPRDLRFRRPYMAGRDVLALQRALARAGVRPWASRAHPFTGTFGAGTRDQVKAFQRRRGLSADGVYGVATHRKLGAFFDTYGIWLLNGYRIVSPAERAQARLVTAAMAAYNDRAFIGYTQGPGRMYLVRHRVNDPSWLFRHVYFAEDCSSTATWLAYAARVDDPNGLGYNGQGFTGTQAANGHRVFSSTAPVGSFNFYGGGPPYSHVTVRVSPGGRCLSHGSSPGPLLVALNYRPDLRQARVYRGLAPTFGLGLGLIENPVGA